MMHFVNADGVIAGPFAVVEAFAERERFLVKSGSDGHESSELHRRREEQERIEL
jgi:hypothetical protein